MNFASQDVSLRLNSWGKHHNLLVFFAFFTAVFLAYRDAFLSNYAWSDDYPTLVDPQSHIQHTLRDLRPGYAALLTIFHLTNSVEDFRLIRILGLTFLSLTAYYLWKILRSHNFGKSAFLGPLLGVCTPPFAGLVYLTVGFGALIAQTLAVYSYYLMERKNLTSRLIAYLCLLSSLLIYPLASISFLSIALVITICVGYEYRRALIDLLTSFYRFVLMGLAGLAIARMLLVFANIPNSNSNERVKVLNGGNFSESIVFFLSRHIVQTFRFFLIDRPSNTVIALQSFLICSCLIVSFLALHGFNKFSLTRILVIFMGLALLMCPFLLFGYNQIEPRFFVNSSLLLTIVFFRNIELILTRFISMNGSVLKGVYNRALLDSLTTTIVLISIFLPGQIFQERVLPITTNTNRFLNQSLLECQISKQTGRIQIINRREPWPNMPYLGMFSQVSDLASGWVPKNALKLKIREPEWIIFSKAKIHEGDSQDNETRQETCAIDLNSFRG